MFRHDPQHTGYTECKISDEVEVLWKYETGAIVSSSPSVANNRVYVGSWDDYLHCFGPKKETSVPTITPKSTSISKIPPQTIFIGCSFDEEWPSPPYKCLKDLWWEDSNKNDVLDPSESREEVYIDIDSGKFEYRTIIEKEPKGITWYGGENNEKSYFLITNPATVKFLGEFYNIIYYNEEGGYFVCGTPHYSETECKGEDMLYFHVGETKELYGWEITLKDTNIYKNEVICLIKNPEDKEPAEYIVKLSQCSTECHNAIGIKERIGDQKFTVFALNTIKMYVGAGGENAAVAIIYVLTDIKLINSNISLSEKNLEVLSNLTDKIRNYNEETPFNLSSKYPMTINIEKKDIEFNPDGKEEYVISLGSELINEKIKTVVSTSPPTTPPPTTTPKLIATTPPPTTTPAPTTSPLTTTSKPTTSAPITTSPPTTTAPSQYSSSLLYLGAFVSVIVCILAVYQITKKKHREIPLEIKSQIEQKKKYIENYKKIIEQDPTKKEMAEKLIRQYEEEIKELERQVEK